MEEQRLERPPRTETSVETDYLLYLALLLITALVEINPSDLANTFQTQGKRWSLP